MIRLKRIQKKSLATLLALASATAASWAVAQDDNAIIDCPLRDSAYSVDTPMMDIVLNPQAKAVVEQAIPILFKALPAEYLSPKPPSLSAIMSVRSMVGMLRIPPASVDFAAIGSQLGAIPLTDADKQARCARYDNEAPALSLGQEEKQLLVFDKVNGFDHDKAVGAATDAIKTIAKEKNWGVTVTDKAGVFTAETLSKFDAVIWNNVSGDVLTLSQRQAFKEYIQQGGSFLGIHGTGGDFIYLWDWFVESLLAAQFIGHTMAPHYQDAKIQIESTPSGIGEKLMPGWVMNEEWYSFAESPRKKGATIVATLDETSYLPEMGGQSLRMGDDHPIAWGQCIENGRSFYTGIGHLPEAYHVAENLVLLEDALEWTVGAGKTLCRAGQEVIAD